MGTPRGVLAILVLGHSLALASTRLDLVSTYSAGHAPTAHCKKPAEKVRLRLED